MHEILIKRVRGRIYVSAHCTMADDLPLSSVHDVSTELEIRFKQEFPELFRVLIHPRTPNRQPKVICGDRVAAGASPPRPSQARQKVFVVTCNLASTDPPTRPRLRLHRHCHVLLGSLRHPRPRRLHRPPSRPSRRHRYRPPGSFPGPCLVFFLVLLAILGLSRRPPALRLPVRDLGQLFLIGILGVAASNYFYSGHSKDERCHRDHCAIHRSHLGADLHHRSRAAKPTLQRVAAVGLAVTGIALVIGLFSPGAFRLDAVGVFAALLSSYFAFYNIGGHDILARRDRWIVLLYTTGSASLFWLLVNPPWKLVAADYSATQWLFLLLFSLVSVLAPFAFYFAGLQHLEPTRAIVVSCLEPVPLDRHRRPRARRADAPRSRSSESFSSSPPSPSPNCPTASSNPSSSPVPPLFPPVLP